MEGIGCPQLPSTFVGLKPLFWSRTNPSWCSIKSNEFLATPTAFLQRSGYRVLDKRVVKTGWYRNWRLHEHNTWSRDSYSKQSLYHGKRFQSVTIYESITWNYKKCLISNLQKMLFSCTMNILTNQVLWNSTSNLFLWSCSYLAYSFGF